MGLLLFFIQNLVIILVDIIIVIIPDLGAILFLASLWIDIIAGIILFLGFKGYSKSNNNEIHSTKRISYMVLIWSSITVIVRVLTNMNFNIQLVTDLNLLLILLTIWVLTSIYFSSIIYNLIKFFSEIDQTSFLIPKLYVWINLISALLIGIGLIPTQTIFSILIAGQEVNTYPSEVVFGIMLLGLGSLSKVTLVPLLGLITFHIFRNVWEIKLSSNNSNRINKLSKTTFKPKRLEFR